MSFQPRGGISEGVVASRPRPSSSVAAREPADEDIPNRWLPPGRRYSIAAAAASRATTGKRDPSCCLGTYFARLRGARYLFVDWRG
jgi:hypothetical protein